MTTVVVRALRLASVAICLLVAASFLLFVLSQTSTASGHQQEEITGSPVGTVAAAPAPPAGALPATQAPASGHENGVRATLDEVSTALTSPAAGLASSSEWDARAVRLLFALLLYGFGLGYLARLLRVR